jgi:hypothetical protein
MSFDKELDKNDYRDFDSGNYTGSDAFAGFLFGHIVTVRHSLSPYNGRLCDDR